MANILLIGRGEIGSRLHEMYPDTYDLISHANFQINQGQIKDYDIVVNCAAIVGAGQCDKRAWQDVLKANINLPNQILKVTSTSKTKFIQLSTIGVYKDQVDNKKLFVDELADTFPHNLYVSSKLLMENQLMRLPYRHVFIFRLPFFINTLKDRIKYWNTIQDTWTSFIDIATLHKAIMNCLEQESAEYPIYNIATSEIYLPAYASENKESQFVVRSEVPRDMTSAITVSTEKAKIRGIL